jgi:hypothetical protein
VLGIFQATGDCIGVYGVILSLGAYATLRCMISPYHPSQMSRFRQRIGPERLEGLMDDVLEKLRNAVLVRGEVMAFDVHS